ncbi:MAG: ACP S-malonyltransferase [Planctomycetota bacterium]
MRLTRRRGLLMQACAEEHPGSMAAVIGLDAPAVDDLCRSVARETGGMVSVANFNSPVQVVITGESAAVGEACRRLKEAGAGRIVALKVSGPWHSALLQSAQEAFGQELSSTPFKAPALPIVANVDAEVKTTAGEVRDALMRQITSPVEWVRSIRALRRDLPQAVYLECGPGSVLKGLLRAIDPGAVAWSVNSVESLEAALAELG